MPCHVPLVLIKDSVRIRTADGSSVPLLEAKHSSVENDSEPLKKDCATASRSASSAPLS